MNEVHTMNTCNTMSGPLNGVGRPAIVKGTDTAVLPRWIVAALLLLSCAGVCPSAFAGWVQWSGNGHYYMAVQSTSGFTWQQASDYATARGAYLATCTSAAENTFVFGLVDSPGYWRNAGTNSQGPWIGGLQPVGSPEPGGGWRWVTTEPFAFTNWFPGEPNNGAGGAQEDRISFFAAGLNTRLSRWNDAGNNYNNLGFVMETDCLPLTQQPLSQTVCCKGPVAFEVTADPGFGPYTYQWQAFDLVTNNWVDLVDGEAQSVPCGVVVGATTRRVVVAPLPNGIFDFDCFINPLHVTGRRFRCVVTGTCGSVTSAEATMTICLADFNCDGMVSSQDFFDFLVAFFAGGCP